MQAGPNSTIIIAVPTSASGDDSSIFVIALSTLGILAIAAVAWMMRGRKK